MERGIKADAEARADIEGERLLTLYYLMRSRSLMQSLFDDAELDVSGY